MANNTVVDCKEIVIILERPIIICTTFSSEKTVTNVSIFLKNDENFQVVHRNFFQVCFLKSYKVSK